MLRFLPIFLFAGLALEIASLIWVGRLIGVLPTLLLLIVSGGIGIRLLKSAGVGMVDAVRSPFQHPSLQKLGASTAVLRTIAGILFLLPGFASDVAALLLLLPPVRHWLASKIKVSPVPAGQSAAPAGRFERVIEADAIEISGEDEPRSGRT